MVSARGYWYCLSLFLVFSRHIFLMTSKITARNTYVKDRMTSTHERTLTERHSEYNNTNTTCRCTRLQYGSGRLLMSMKKEVTGTFLFTCSVKALPVSYFRRLNLCTPLSTWSPRFTSHDLYLRCRSLASLAKRSFYFGPPKIHGNKS